MRSLCITYQNPSSFQICFLYTWFLQVKRKAGNHLVVIGGSDAGLGKLAPGCEHIA